MELDDEQIKHFWGNSGTYSPPNDGTNYWDSIRQAPQIIERQYLQEPDYKLEAVKAASTIPSENLEQFMSRVDFIHKYLTEKSKTKQQIATDKYMEPYH